jgi:3-hydroxyacyl-[acyl-carrier-protein] dehydratase
VDDITSISEDKIEGNYTFPVDHPIYKGHFVNNPLTPGVILIECMAQIGVVCLGVYLMDQQRSDTKESKFAMSSSSVEYFKPVLPGTKVYVESVKQYFRFNKLKCSVVMKDCEGKLICKGEIAGMIINNA